MLSETTLALLSALFFWFCSYHNSGLGRDVELMEKLIFLLPFILASVAFATIFAPGAKNWWWLARAVVFTFVAMFVCGARLISGLGSGAKGQDAAFILLILLGTVAVAFATAVTGSMLLATTQPVFASWFRVHKFLGSLLTVISAVPIGFVLGTAVTAGSAFWLAFWSALFKG